MLHFQPEQSADKLPLYHPLHNLIRADDLLRYAQYHAGCCGDDVHHEYDRGHGDSLHGRDDDLHDRDNDLHDRDDGLHGHDDGLHDRDDGHAHQGFPLPHHLLLPYCMFL